jgi:hypothetical protein
MLHWRIIPDIINFSQNKIYAISGPKTKNKNEKTIEKLKNVVENISFTIFILSFCHFACISEKIGNIR